MWGVGPWGGPLWGLWWIFPLLGLLACILFMVVAGRIMGRRHGFMCMGGHSRAGGEELGEMRREIHALREEIRQLSGNAGRP